MIKDYNAESYSEFRSRCIVASRNYNPSCGTVDIPTQGTIFDNGIKFVENPVEMDGDEIVTSVSKMYNGFKFVDWSDWKYLLAVVHRKFHTGLDQYIVRGVLRDEVK